MGHRLLKYFHWEHLPTRLQNVSKPFCELAKQVAKLQTKDERDDAELTVALRKLLEAKDAAVRAMLD